MPKYIAFLRAVNAGATDMPHMKNYHIVKIISLVAYCFALELGLCAQSNEIRLWPNGAPGSEGKSGAEKVRVTEQGERVISNVHAPSLTPYLPAPAQATGAAVIIAPGGGHRELWADHEGHNLARYLSARGIAAFVLKYRLAREADSTYKIDEHAFADMQRAIRLVRAKAKEWNVNPARVGAIGFSAGGELAALSGMRFDAGNKDAADVVERESSRPDFHALIYPGSSARYTVSKESPSVFIACGYKDRKDIAEGMAEVYLKFKQAGVPAELHIYSEIGHGFGVRETTKGAAAGWPARFIEWMADLGLTKKP
jgi:endo-1,4-beta-xylanase